MAKTKMIRILMLSIGMVLAACTGSKMAAPPADSTVGMLKEYRIGVGDQLQINVWKNPDLSVSIPVRPDGKISVPLVGDAPASGHTAQELTEILTASLSNYVRNPQVTVLVTTAASADYLQRVRVTGAVVSPQSIAFRSGMTVLDLVLQAGGLTPFARANDAKLYRQIDGQLKVYPIRANDILQKGRLETNYPLLPSDIVTIPERSF